MEQSSTRAAVPKALEVPRSACEITIASRLDPDRFIGRDDDELGMPDEASRAKFVAPLEANNSERI
jgi:hypothetical protein